MLTQDDVMLGRTFPDQVAYGGWWLDLHPPTGIDAVDEQPCVQHHTPHLYGIPLGILHSRNVDNLFMAGRNVSATHVAFASTRVMGTCAVMGQAVGTVAAHLIRAGATGITNEAKLIGAVQQSLLKDDCFLPGVRNEEPADLARTAAVAASAEASDAPAANVLTGVSRTVSATWGPWADKRPNHWRSAALPTWIELTFDGPTTVAAVHLTFDSGLHRELILTASDSITRKVVRGPQPELVRNYTLLLDDRPVVAVRDNYLRHCVHRFSPTTCWRVRVWVEATHGVHDARVYEIRCYAAE